MTKSTTVAVDSIPVPVPLPSAWVRAAKADGAGTGGGILSRVSTATTSNSSRFDRIVPGSSSQPTVPTGGGSMSASEWHKTGEHGPAQVENIRPTPNRPRAVNTWRSSVQREGTAPFPESVNPRMGQRATHVGTFAPVVPKSPSTSNLPSRATATATTTNTKTSTITTTTTTSRVALTTTTQATASTNLHDRPATLQSAREARQLDALTLQIPQEIQKRAKQRECLLAALKSMNPEAIARAMENIPSEVTLASYFPVADAEHFDRDWSKSARQFAKVFFEDEELTRYLGWYEIHHQQIVLSNAMLEADPGLRASIKPTVVTLCKALRALHENIDPENLRLSANAIGHMLLDASVTARALAEQPCASTRMMLQKCTLLQACADCDGEAFLVFRQTLMKAHKIRKRAHAGLQDALLGKIFNESVVVNMATSAYARAVTIPTVGYLRPDTPPAQLKTMQTAVEKLLRSPSLNPLQVAALHHVKESILTLAAQRR